MSGFVISLPCCIGPHADKILSDEES
jgi:hypothetical protein